MGEIAKGKDTAAQKKAHKESPLMKDLARDYLERHAISSGKAVFTIKKDASKSAIVHVKLPKLSIPAVLKNILEQTGEDD